MRLRWPTAIAGFISWLASSITAGAILVLADFGAPLWIFIALGIWLGTAGLPTALGILLVASAWGRIPGIGTPPLGAAIAGAAVVSLAFQMAAAALAAGVLRRIRGRPSCG